MVKIMSHEISELPARFSVKATFFFFRTHPADAWYMVWTFSCKLWGRFLESLYYMRIFVEGTDPKRMNDSNGENWLLAWTTFWSSGNAQFSFKPSWSPNLKSGFGWEMILSGTGDVKSSGILVGCYPDVTLDIVKIHQQTCGIVGGWITNMSDFSDFFLVRFSCSIYATPGHFWGIQMSNNTMDGT